MTPCISVVIPVFNCAQYVNQAIESVLSQTYSGRTEIIVVDDGSTDNIDAVVRPYLSRIRYIKQANGGIGAGRNGGIKLATGNYVAFLDADDYWLPDRLTKTTQFAIQQSESFIITDLQIFDARSGRLSPQGYIAEKGYGPFFELRANEQYTRLLRGSNFLNYMFMLPRHVFDLVGLFDESLHAAEDFDFQLRCLRYGIPARLVAKALAVYRVFRPGATTTWRDPRRLDSLVTVLSKHRAQVPNSRWATVLAKRDESRVEFALEQGTYVSAFSNLARLIVNGEFVRQLVGGRWRRIWRYLRRTLRARIEKQSQGQQPR